PSSPTFVSLCHLFFFHSSAAPLALLSFPTRRSSDLAAGFNFASADGEFLVLLFEFRNDVAAYFGARVGVPVAGGTQYAATSLRKDRKSTRLNSSHGSISYAVFCLKKKIIKRRTSMK